MQKIPTVTDIENVAGKRVLVRIMCNVDIEGGKIVDDYRLRQSLHTVNYLKDNGARVVLISHIGGKEDTLRPVYEYFKAQFDISFVGDCLSEHAHSQIEKMSDGDVVMLENTRAHDGEIANDSVFAQKLASLGDVFVNEAFSVSHRHHASIVGIPNYLPSYAGIWFEKEIETLKEALSPKHPFVFIAGGAKLDTKLPLLEKFLGIADHVFLGGALVKPLVKHMNGVLKEDELNDIDISSISSHERLSMPSDVVCLASDGSHQTHKTNEWDESCGDVVDVGEVAREDLKKLIKEAKLVVWNGPLGWYEKGYYESSIVCAQAIKENKGVHALVGGGDTVSVLKKHSFSYEDAFSFISTGGGAMLSFLTDETLPGIEAIAKSHQ